MHHLAQILSGKMSVPQRTIVLERGERSRESDSHRWIKRNRYSSWLAWDELKQFGGYSVIILSAHSTSETKIFGLPNLAPYSVKSASVTPLAREHAPHA